MENEDIVERCERSCHFMETDEFLSTFVMRYTKKQINVSVTVANISMYYFVSLKHECSHNEHKAFEKLYYLSKSTKWPGFSKAEKQSLIEKNAEIMNHVFCFEE
jgi:hypothetical protein